MGEVIKSELDLFKKVSFQRSIENSYIIEYRPTSVLSESSAIEFDIPISLDEYLDLQNVYIKFKGKLTDEKGVDYDENQNNRFSLINYSLNTIFDQLSIYVGGTLVSQSSNTYHYLSFIEKLINSTPNNIKTILRTSNYVSPFGNKDYDFDGIDEQLASITNKSKVFTLYGRPHGSLFNSDKLLMNGLNLRLIFNRASPQFYCMGRSADPGGVIKATTPKLNLLDISIFARKVKVNSDVLLAHNRALTISKAIYPIKRTVVKVLNMPSGQSTFMLDNVFIGQMPSKIVFGLVTNNAFSGSYLLNPFAFKNFGLNYICAHQNGETVPKNPYEPDFRGNFMNYEREYYDFFLNIGADKTSIQPAIDYLNYSKGQCLYCFNFNSDLESINSDEYINIPKSGFLNIELKFRSNLTEALKAICFAQFDNTIEIDENRNVFIDYSG